MRGAHAASNQNASSHKERRGGDWSAPWAELKSWGGGTRTRGGFVLIVFELQLFSEFSAGVFCPGASDSIPERQSLRSPADSVPTVLFSPESQLVFKNSRIV